MNEGQGIRDEGLNASDANIRSYRDLVVWQRAIQMTSEIYKSTRAFPKEEMYGLVSQLRRAGVSVASNIAEGYGRASRGEYRQFLCMARGSNYEVQTQLTIAGHLSYGTESSLHSCQRYSTEVEKMLNALVLSLGDKK
jgi:four helix bundle protein